MTELQRPPITDAERQQVIDLHAQELSYLEIAERTKMSVRRIDSILRAYAARSLVETPCVDCSVIIKQWIRPYERRFCRCAKCAAALWRERSLLLDAASEAG